MGRIVGITYPKPEDIKQQESAAENTASDANADIQPELPCDEPEIMTEEPDEPEPKAAKRAGRR